MGDERDKEGGEMRDGSELKWSWKRCRSELELSWNIGGSVLEESRK